MAASQYKLLKRKENAHSDSIWAVVWTADDKIVTGSIDGTICVWDPKELALERTIQAHDLGIISLSVQADRLSAQAKRDFVASTSFDSTIKIWDTLTGELKRCIEVGPVEAWSCSLSRTGSHVAAGTNTGKVNIFNTETGVLESTLDTGADFVLSVMYSPHHTTDVTMGDFIAAGTHSGVVFVFDVANKTSRKLEGHALPVRSLSFEPDGGVLRTACDDTHVNAYDVVSSGMLSSVAAHASWVLAVQHDATSMRFATASSDKEVKIWSSDQSNQLLHTFRGDSGHRDQVWALAFDATSDRLVSVGEDAAILVYETPASHTV